MRIRALPNPQKIKEFTESTLVYQAILNEVLQMEEMIPERRKEP